jgi:hypothetical protein
MTLLHSGWIIFALKNPSSPCFCAKSGKISLEMQTVDTNFSRRKAMKNPEIAKIQRKNGTSYE